MSRQRPYPTYSGPVKPYDAYNRRPDDMGYRLDHGETEDRRDGYRPPERGYPQPYEPRPYYADSQKSRPPRYDGLPPKRNIDDGVIISDRHHVNSDEEIAFILKTEREINPPITLTAAPILNVAEYWD